MLAEYKEQNYDQIVAQYLFGRSKGHILCSKNGGVRVIPFTRAKKATKVD
jgi:hypothetical protein